MIGPEFRNYSEEQFTSEAVNEIKHAAVGMMPSFEWLSSDGFYAYSASPKEPDEVVEDFILHLPSLSAEDYKGVLNKWVLFRMRKADELGQIATDIYTLSPGKPMVVSSHDIDRCELLDGSLDGDEFLSKINADIVKQCGLGLSEPELADYAAVDNALFDLEPIAGRALINLLKSVEELSDEERLWDKQASGH